MGNIAGMPEMPTEDIKATCKEVMETFAPLYAKSFALGLIQQLRAEAEAKASDADGFQLLTPPVPSDVLRRGFVSKKGGFMSGWKRRFFVATNQADNFRILYFGSQEEQSDPRKKKGEIQPCGYRVKHLTMEEEVKEFGEHALTLKPYGRRRQWFLRFDNAEELKEWTEVLRIACRRAAPPLNPDPVLQFAFKRAYRMTRWRLDVWGWCSFDCTEQEALGQLVVDRCEEGCMVAVYERIPSGRIAYKIRKAVTSALDKTVGAAVGVAWKAAMQSTAGAKDSLEAKAREFAGPVFDKQAELEAKIEGMISGAVGPPLAKITDPIMTPLCTVLMGPLGAAFKELCFGYHARMTAIIADGITESDLRAFLRDVRRTWGVMRPALVHVWRALRMNWSDGDEPETSKVTFRLNINIGDVLDCFQGVDVWRVEEQFEDALRTTMTQAIYTFVYVLEHETGEGRMVTATDVLASTLAKMVHDARLHIVKQVTSILTLIIKPPFKKAVDPMLRKTLAPVENLIPGPLKTFLDVDKMAEGILDKALGQVITKCVQPASVPVLSMFDTVMSEVGFA